MVSETVEQVCEKMDDESGEYHIDDYGLSSYDIGLYKERILTAHKSEMAELDSQIVHLSSEIDRRDELIKELVDELNDAKEEFEIRKNCEFDDDVVVEYCDKNITRIDALVAKVRGLVK